MKRTWQSQLAMRSVQGQGSKRLFGKSLRNKQTHVGTARALTSGLGCFNLLWQQHFRHSSSSLSRWFSQHTLSTTPAAVYSCTISLSSSNHVRNLDPLGYRRGPAQCLSRWDQEDNGPDVSVAVYRTPSLSKREGTLQAEAL